MQVKKVVVVLVLTLFFMISIVSAVDKSTINPGHLYIGNVTKTTGTGISILDTDLIITNVTEARISYAGKPDKYLLTFQVKNQGGKKSGASNIGYCVSWTGYEGGVTTDVVKPQIDVPSIEPGKSITVKKYIDEDPTGKLSVCSISVNIQEPGCFGGDCIPVIESNYNNNAWPGCYQIPDTLNSTKVPLYNHVPLSPLNQSKVQG